MFFELKFCVFMPGYIKTQSFVRQTCDKHHALTSCTLLHSQGLKGRVFLRAGVSWNTYNYFSNLRRPKGMYINILFAYRYCKITTKAHKPLLYLTLSTKIHTRWG